MSPPFGGRRFDAPCGFLTFAQQTEGRDYLRMAYALALSLKATQREHGRLSVVVTPGTDIPDRYVRAFDRVVDVPWLDEARGSAWKLENEWKAFHCTPYESTIKLDADMVFVEDISWWWPALARHDALICSQAMTYLGTPIPPTAENPYRACFAANKLPDVYTALLFFRQTERAKDLFAAAEAVFHDWQRYFEEFLEPVTRPQEVSTDVVFAIAMRVAGMTEECLAPHLPIPAFAHVKSRLQGWPEALVGEAWTKHVRGGISARDGAVRIGNVRQTWPVHYHDKAFLTDAALVALERAAGLA